MPFEERVYILELSMFYYFQLKDNTRAYESKQSQRSWLATLMQALPHAILIRYGKSKHIIK